MCELNISTQLDHHSKRGRKRRRKDTDRCLVCGDHSVGINFGVHTCSPCKAFFRRNAIKLASHQFVCNGEGDCPVTSSTRRKCNCCRLAKCFLVGMNPNAIRTDDENHARKQLIEHNKQRKAKESQTTEPLSFLQLPNQSGLSLSKTDLQLLKDIFDLYKQTCDTCSSLEHLLIPSDNQISVLKFMNSISPMHIALVNYFKGIPNFSNLPIETKIYLLKSNFLHTFRIYHTIVLVSTDRTDLINSVVVKHILPVDLFIELHKTAESFFPFGHDVMFLKLMLIILILSTSLSVRCDTNEYPINAKQIFSAQNFYVELLWRYISCRYSTYCEAVRFMTSCIMSVLRSQVVVDKLNEYVTKASSDYVDHLEPIIKEMWFEENVK